MTTSKPEHLVLVEDERSLALLYKEYLKDENLRVTHVSSGREAIELLDRDTPDAMMLDIRLPDMMGTEVLKEINARGLSVATVMITAHGSINTAVETMRSGAYDFLVKPFNRDRLIQTLSSALSRHKVAVKVQQREVKFHTDFQGFIGSSKPMQVVYRMIESAAGSRATCFITGESGTGKEVAAEAIHKLSKRSKKPFVILNCAAIPKDLMESEIFGHVKGAFTGAVLDQEGAASRANGGTLFLDEICEMEPHLQTKLLRFIQTETFNKVGSGRTEKVSIRFVCATNRDPLIEIGEGRFREDLYYRLHVIPIPMPALRERGNDVIAIAEKFLRAYATEEEKEFVRFSDKAAHRLVHYNWPGNVRQLQNVIRNTVVLNDGSVVEASMLPPPLNSYEMCTPAKVSALHHYQSGSDGTYFKPTTDTVADTVNGIKTEASPDLMIPNEENSSSGNKSEDFAKFQHPKAGFSRQKPDFHQTHGKDPGLAHDLDQRFANFKTLVSNEDNSGQLNNRDNSSNAISEMDIQPLSETEKRAILHAIKVCKGNIPKAATMLGISASTIYRKKQLWDEEDEHRHNSEDTEKRLEQIIEFTQSNGEQDHL